MFFLTSIGKKKKSPAKKGTIKKKIRKGELKIEITQRKKGKEHFNFKDYITPHQAGQILIYLSKEDANPQTKN